MPKGYIIGRIDVHDMEAFQPFVPLSAIAQEKYGGRVLVRDPAR